MLEEREDGLLIAAEPIALAERICKTLVDEVSTTTDGTLLLDTNPAFAGAINTVLVMKGATVSELHRVTRWRPHRTRRVSIGHA